MSSFPPRKELDRMKRLLLPFITLLLLTPCTNCVGQSDSWFKGTPILFGAVNYSQNVSGKILPSNGTHLSLGLNIAGLFSRKFTLGVMVDVRGFKALGSNRQYGQLTNAINTYIINNQSNPLDSTYATFLYSAFNNDDRKCFFGSYLVNYGLFFSPFPCQYGGIMLQIKRGNYGFPIYGAYKNPYIANGEHDWADFTVPTPLNIQLTFKPLTFFNTEGRELLANNVLFSIFYEQVSLKKATLEKQSLTKYLRNEFFDNYVKNNFKCMFSKVDKKYFVKKATSVTLKTHH